MISNTSFFYYDLYNIQMISGMDGQVWRIHCLCNLKFGFPHFFGKWLLNRQQKVVTVMPWRISIINQ